MSTTTTSNSVYLHECCISGLFSLFTFKCARHEQRSNDTLILPVFSLWLFREPGLRIRRAVGSSQPLQTKDVLSKARRQLVFRTSELGSRMAWARGFNSSSPERQESEDAA